jgi:hypothetical protein
MDSPVMQWGMFIVGAFLLVISPIIGAIPGPGGIIVAAIGLAMVLKTSLWARRRYVRFKRWQPKVGNLADLAMRRPSARRRNGLRKAQRKAEQAGLGKGQGD